MYVSTVSAFGGSKHLSTPCSLGVLKKDKGGKRSSQLTVTWLDNLCQQYQSTMDKKPVLANLAAVPVKQHVAALWIQCLLSQPSVARLELLEAPQTAQGGWGGTRWGEGDIPLL